MKKSEIAIGLVIGAAVAAGIASVVFFDKSGSRGSGLSDEYKYDISKYASTDPKLVLYKSLPGEFNVDMKKTAAIAVDDAGILYIAGDNRIDKAGRISIELSKMPGCLDIGKDGKIYVGIDGHVEVYDVDGRKLAGWDYLGENAVLTSIAVGDEDVFVADAGRRVVVRYDLEGNIVNEIGRKDELKNIDGFVIPSPYFDLAIADDGLLRVVNPGMHRIEAYTFDGYLEFWWGRPGVDIEGFCGCCNPINFAILSDGSFVTCEKGLVRVKVYDADGKFVGVVAGSDVLSGGTAVKACQTPADCQSGGFDVAVDSKDRVYVLDTNANTVRIFVRKDAFEGGEIPWGKI